VYVLEGKNLPTREWTQAFCTVEVERQSISEAASRSILKNVESMLQSKPLAAVGTPAGPKGVSHTALPPSSIYLYICMLPPPPLRLSACSKAASRCGSTITCVCVFVCVCVCVCVYTYIHTYAHGVFILNSLLMICN